MNAPTMTTASQPAAPLDDARAFESEASIAYLKALDPEGLHNLVAIHPRTEEIEGRTFAAGRWEEMREWIEARNGHLNLYYSVNEPMAGSPHKKLGREHIGRIRAVYADVDPLKGGDLADEKARLAALARQLERDPLNQPSFTVVSGNGVQFIWKLDEPIDARRSKDWAEGVGRSIKKKLNGDSVENIDRILRLPGTVNLPDAAKAKQGRKAALATLVFESGGTHKPKWIEDWAPPITSGTRPDEFAEIASVMAAIDMAEVQAAVEYDELPEELRRRFDDLCAADPSIGSLWQGDRTARPGSDDSGSGFAFALGIVLRRSGKFTPTEFGQLLFVWEQSNPEKIDARYIARAWARNSAPSAEEEFEAAADVPPAPSQKRRLSFELAAGVDFSTENTALIAGWFDRGAMVVTYGESGAGKTHLVLSQAFSIAAGQPWAGCDTQPGLVVYVAAEGGRGIRKRVKAWTKRYGNVPFALVPCPVDLLRPTGDTNALIDLVREAETATNQKCAMVVIDTLSRALSGGNENAPDDMGALVMHCDRIREATGAAVNVIHHSGKNTAAGARGHSLLKAATDTEIEISGDRHRGSVKVTKQRDMDYPPPMSFTLETVDVEDIAGRRSTTAIAIVSKENEFESRLPSGEHDALDALELIAQAKGRPNQSVQCSEWRAQVRGSEPKSSEEKSRFNRLVRNLVQSGHVNRIQRGQYVRTDLVR